MTPKSLRQWSWNYLGKFICSLLLSAVVLSATGQNNRLIGLITYQNTGEPVDGVSITPTEGANPTQSNDVGQFQLAFSGKSPGDIVKLILTKDQYRVIGPDPVIIEVALRREAGDVVRIVMVKKEEYARREDKYVRAIEKQLAQKDEEILFYRSQLTENKLTDTERRGLTQKIGALIEEVEQLEKSKAALAQKLAQVDLDQASSFAKEALEEFEKGDLEKALALMEDEALDNYWNNVLTQEERLKRAREQGVENYMIKARLLSADGQFEGAYKNYSKAIERDSTNVSNLWEMADYCGELNRQKSAIHFYENALQHVKTESQRASLLNNLGIQFVNNNQYDRAGAAYSEALSIRKRLAEKNPESYEPGVAQVQNNLGNMYRELHAYQQAESAYLEALVIRKRLMKVNPERFEPGVAIVQNNLGLLYTDLNDYKKAEAAYAEALAIRKRLAETNPARFEPEVATVRNNMGNMYADLSDYTKAEKSYAEAREIYQRLARENPGRYEPDVAMTQINLGILYADLNAYDQAETAYLEALNVYRRLAGDNPERYEPAVAATQNKLGILYVDLGAYDQAEAAYLEALEIRKQLAAANPGRFEPELAMTQNNLGNMYADLNAFDKAKAAYLNALEISRRLAEVNPERFEPELAATQDNLGNLYFNLNDFEQAEAAYLEALSIRKRLAENNPGRFEPDVATSLNNLGGMYSTLQNYDQAESAYLKALSVRKHLAEEYPGRFEPDLAATYNNLGTLYNNLQDYDQAEKAFMEALEIFQRLAKDNPERFDSEVAALQGNLGWMFYQLGDASQAMVFLAQSLPAYRRLAAQSPQAYDLSVARILLMKALALISQEDQSAANAALLEAKALAQQYPEAPFSATVLEYFDQLFQEVNQPFEQAKKQAGPFKEQIASLNNEADKVKPQEQIVQLLTNALQNHPDNRAIRTHLAGAYGNLAWYRLFTRDFPAAEEAARQGLSTDSAQTWINANLALSLLFQGKYGEAEALYKKFKDEPVNDSLDFKTAFMKDLETLEAAGITHPDVKKVRRILEE